MPYRSLDELRVELGLPTKGCHKEKVGDYTNINLHFRMTMDDAKRLLLVCRQLDISESQFARRAILKAME